MTRTAAETREHVLQVAHDLFYWHGIRATGVDKVAAEAGVAPTTLYRLFASKDDLVAAYVDRVDQQTREWFRKATEDDGRDAHSRILGLFDAVAEHIEHDCRGCAFMMALAEFPNPDLPAHRNAVAAKTWVRATLGELTAALAADEEVDDPSALADQLALVIEGVHASAQALGSHGPARQGRLLAERILLACTGRAPVEV
ncbi:TetR family transcriptional regulator [Saccharothrix sp. 6-C]|uniref:TetR/AcrR family transcriptional regulator n=1 Tax=Saccharothrix sp. 6-C TaxID=2781735 RepID=UPI0019178D5F|nr:TetR family transcriptional regulator [Saccharothrix sp. 6-C]QQQ79644.1 TetR family transcriptional regulator [Saccharothrix sp. 6-C]